MPVPEHMRVRWQGGVITVRVSGEWFFHCCCNCHRQLSDPASRARGYGSECAKLVDIDMIVDLAMSRDRTKMRLDLAARRARERRTAAEVRRAAP